MPTVVFAPPSQPTPFRPIARIITCLWAGIWAFFLSVAMVIVRHGLDQKILALLVVTLLFVLPAWVPFRRERLGGILLFTDGFLLACGSLLFLDFQPSAMYTVFGTLSLPPVLLGLLFVYLAQTPPPPAPES